VELRMINLIGWPLLILSLFLGQWREQIFVMQTVICTLVKQQPFHIATLLFLFLYFTQHSEQFTDYRMFVLHHVVVATTNILRYIDSTYQTTCWVIMCWSTRWLASIHFFAQPVRSCFKCLIFAAVLNGKWGQERRFVDGFKWCWILLVHEVALVALPVQMLYEVYSKKKNIDLI